MDALFDGRHLRALTVADASTREALALDVGQGVKSEQVVATMTRISSIRGAAGTIRVDDGPEFIPKALDRCAYANDATFAVSRPGKPTDHALVESFDGHLRDEGLNAPWFVVGRRPLRIEAWRQGHGGSRPRTSPGWRRSDRRREPDAWPSGAASPDSRNQLTDPESIRR